MNIILPVLKYKKEARGESLIIMDILKNIYKINKFIQENGLDSIDYNVFFELINEVLNVDIAYLDTDGNILGKNKYNLYFESKIDKYDNDNLLSRISVSAVNDLSTILTKSPFVSEDKGFIVPIQIAGQRFGTCVVVCRDLLEKELSVLFEVIATFIAASCKIQLDNTLKNEEKERSAAIAAVQTLSYSEATAMKSIFNSLNGDEGLLVASKIADKEGLTRSVIVNALRKFESAGTLHSRSLGMKGTYIKVLNPYLINTLREFKR